jgi:glutamate synthase domain-containing protein 3
MHTIDYEINLNERGRPCIGLPESYKDKPEDKFFAIEIARYVLQNTYDRLSEHFDIETAKKLDITLRVLGQIGDQMAEILWNSMKASGDAEMIMGKSYNVSVDTIEERNDLATTGILEGEKIFLREEGLKVLVENENKIYKLTGGNTNNDWIELPKWDEIK